MLKDCIARAGKNIPPAVAERMVARADELIAAGTPAKEAESQAVREGLDAVRKESERLGIPLSEGGDRIGREERRQGQEVLSAATLGPEGQPMPLRSPATERLGRLIRATSDRNALERERAAARRAGKPTEEIERRMDGERSSLGDRILWRAGDSDERGIRPWAAFSEEKDTAIAYLDNPGYGGEVLRSETAHVSESEVLTVDTRSRRGTVKLAVAIGLGPEEGERWFDDGWRYPWEESSKVRSAIVTSGFKWLRYADDFPEGATTIVRTAPEDGTRPESPDIRNSLGDEVVRVEADRIRQEFPSAPEFVIESGLSWDDPRKGAVFRDGKVFIHPAALGSRKQARNAILGALTEAGAELFEPTFWGRLWTLAREADPHALRRLMVRTDTTTPEGRRAVLGQLMHEHLRGEHVTSLFRRMIRTLQGYSSKKFLRQLARYTEAKEFFRPATRNPPPGKTWMGRRYAPGAGYTTEFFPSEEEARAFAGDAGTVRDVTQERAFADLHGAWYRTLSPRLASLRTMASELGLDARERTLWEGLERYVQNLADTAEAAVLPTWPLGSARPRLNTDSETFPDEFETMAGRPLTDREMDAWTRYRAELDARRAARMVSRLAELERTDASLSRLDPRWGDPSHPEFAALKDDRKRFRAMTTRLRNRVAKLSDVTRARADEILLGRDVLAQARAAESVLADPFWVQAAEIIDRIDDAGLTPAAFEEMDPLRRHAAEEVRNYFHATYLAYRNRTAKLAGTGDETRAAALVKLRERMVRARAGSGAAEAAIKEVRDALEGAHGTSGSLASRDIATALRDLDTAITIFARELAGARPDTPVWSLREFIETPDPTVPLDLRDEARRVTAEAMGLSVDAFSRILDLIQRYDEFRNGILAMHDAAERADHSATITAIEEIERRLAAGTDEDRRAAAAVAGRTVSRLRRTWKGRDRLAQTLNDEIESVLTEQLASDLSLESAAEEVADPGYVREMIYPTADGEYLVPFTRVDGAEQPGIHLRPGDDYTEDVLAQVSAWRDHARAVVAAGESTTNDMETVRGLAVAVSADGDAGVSKYIDPMALPAMRRRTKAPGRAMDLATDPHIGIKALLAHLVPGVLGNRLREKGAQYIRAEQRINQTINANIRREYKLVKAAAESLGIDLRKPGGAGKFETAYNEIAHELRQFGSDVAPGNLLRRRSIRGREVTPEMLALLRFHRDVFADLQAWLGTEPYGGVRLRFPGRRVVRPPAPTGDLGLGRFVRRDRVAKLAEAYRDAADTGTETPILAFWNKDPDALLTHVLDSARVDLGTGRDPALHRAAQEAARDIRRRGDAAAIPTTVDEWADYLATFLSVPEPRKFAREKLLGELAQYGSLARSVVRIDSKAPATGAGTYEGEDDANEFNSPAANLHYPSSWYSYGASDGLRQAIERIADRRQTEYFAALLAARNDLRLRAAKVKEALNQLDADADPADRRAVIDPVRDDVIWHTDGMFTGPKITRLRMAAALRRMTKRQAAIDAHFHDMNRKRSANPVSRVLGQIVPFMLASYTSALTNILGGPVRQFTMLRPLIGAPAAALAVPLGIGSSALTAAYEGLLGMMPEVIRSRFKPREEMVAYLTSLGLGSSYSRQEMAELETFASGLPGRSPGGVVLGQVQEGVRALSERIGVHAGDKVLNRYASRFVIPTAVWRLRTAARAWLARVGPGYDPTNPDHALSTADLRAAFDVTGQLGSGDAARVREILASLGLGNAEDALRALASEDVNPRLFWRSTAGRAVGQWALGEFNVANRLNRPTPSLLGFLWGWASSATSALIEDARSTPDEKLLRRLGHKAVWGAGVATSAMLAAYATVAGKAAAQAAISSASAALAALLKPDDDEDEWTVVDTIMDLLSRFAGAFQNYTQPKQMLHDRGFWMNAGPDATPGTADDQFKDKGELAAKLGMLAASAYGWDIEGGRIPAASVTYQLARSSAQMGRGMYYWAEGKLLDDPGTVVGGESDTQEGARQLASMLGLVGKTLYNMRYPEDQEGRISRQAILDAANGLGIQKAVAPPVTGFVAPTPVRRELQEAGRAIVDGDPDAAERARSIASFIWQRSYERSIRAGDADAVARKNADSAVKRNLSGLNPFETALGRTLTPEQYAKLREVLGSNPAIKRDEAAAEAVIRAISEKPPGEMKPFAPSSAMLSPVRSEGFGGTRRVSLGRRAGGSRLRGLRGLRRRGRLPTPRRRAVRIRWA